MEDLSECTTRSNASIGRQRDIMTSSSMKRSGEDGTCLSYEFTGWLLLVCHGLEIESSGGGDLN